MKVFYSLGFIFIILLISFSCDEEIDENSINNIDQYLVPLQKSDQRAGDAKKGHDYLLYGDYVDSGLPLAFFDGDNGMFIDTLNNLNRNGRNSNISSGFTAFKSSEGVDLVSPNCMQCHGGKVNGQYVLGLGNTEIDFTIDRGIISTVMANMMKSKFDENSPEWKAYQPFANAMKATSKHLVTEVVGANAANKLALVLAAHRNQDDLRWNENPSLTIPNEVVPADVPAWWLLKKKYAMFSTAVGRGDFARIMMASSLLTMRDSTQARMIDSNFVDVVAFINTIEAPRYPKEINYEKANNGKIVFEDNCSKCHGRYGKEEYYPNYLVDLELVKTDSSLAKSNYAYNDFVKWYNGSWFNSKPGSAYMQPGNGYVAPPLDGVWATAPYLHNGSVPTIRDLLKSSDRPKIWRRTYESEDYDFKKLGWNYDKMEIKQDKYTYDTVLPGYGNQGHTFGDKLTELERESVIEYLKML